MLIALYVFSSVSLVNYLQRRRRRWGCRIPGYDSSISILNALTGIRWLILRIIGNYEKTTSEIYTELSRNYGVGMPRSLLYYHLSELERMNVIEMTGYRETGKGGAPEKVWKLKIKKIIIDIIGGKITTE